MIKRFTERIKRGWNFIVEDIWEKDLSSLSRGKRRWIGVLKIAGIACRGFVRDKCALQASALTFVMLMAIVPALALAMSVAKGLDFDDALIAWINSQAAAFPEQVADWLARMVGLVKEKTNFLALGALGSIVIVWSIIEVMSKIESTLNRIWRVRTDRTLVRQFSDYLGILVVAPFLFLLATSINTALPSEQLTSAIREHFGGIYTLCNALLLQLLGLCGIIAALFFIYIFMPNTKVRWRAALGGAVCAGIMWVLWQKFCINFQFWVTRYNRIYGTFISLPVALFWLHVHWMIILLGAEISFGFQSHRTYTLDDEADQVSFALRRRLAFRLVFEVCRAFKFGDGSWRPEKLETESHIPAQLIDELLQQLKQHSVLVEAAGADAWVPAKDPADLTLRDVESAVTGDAGGIFAHLGKLPEPLLPALDEPERAYLAGLESKTFAELLEKQG